MNKNWIKQNSKGTYVDTFVGIVEIYRLYLVAIASCGLKGWLCSFLSCTPITCKVDARASKLFSRCSFHSIPIPRKIR